MSEHRRYLTPAIAAAVILSMAIIIAIVADLLTAESFSAEASVTVDATPGFLLFGIVGLLEGMFVPVALVMSGRRRYFWLPTLIQPLIVIISSAFYVTSTGWNEVRNQLVWVVINLVISGIAVLVPAILLVRRVPEPEEPPPGLDGIGWIVSGTLLTLACLVQGALRVLDAPGLVSLIDGWLALSLLAEALPIFLFGALIGRKRPWWPWALTVPFVASILQSMIQAVFWRKPWGWEQVPGFFEAPGFITALIRALPQLIVPFMAALWIPIQRSADSWSNRFPSGFDITLRERWGGEIWAARPATAVLDRWNHQQLYVPIGATWWFPADHEGNEMHLPIEDWRLEEGTMTTRHILSFAWRDKPYAVLLAWDRDWKFTGYYVNLQTPLERTPLGFDYTDHVLDIEMSPDKQTWNWKDEDDLERMAEEGLFTPKQVEEFHTWGKVAVEHILYETPFDEDWSDWRPDPDWPAPELSGDWDSLEL